MNFPVYRKYTNNQSYFIITDENSWTEFKKVGSKYLKFEFIATQFPEKLFIKDLLELMEGVEPSSQEEIDLL